MNAESDANVRDSCYFMIQFELNFAAYGVATRTLLTIVQPVGDWRHGDAAFEHILLGA